MKINLTTNQKLTIFFFLVLIAEGIFLNSKFTIQLLAGLIFLGFMLNLTINIVALNKPKSLPSYSILCIILNEEINTLNQFIEKISNLDYPKDKLEVLLLLKESDTEAIQKTEKQLFTKNFKGVVVPRDQSETKSQILNYGLSYAKGEKIEFFNINDTPDPLILKNKLLENQNILTRLFTTKNIYNSFNLFGKK